MNTESKNPDRTPNRRLSMKERRDVFKWMENNRDWAGQRTMKDIFKAFTESHPDIPLTVNGLRQHFNELEFVYLHRDEAKQPLDSAQLVRCDDSPTLALALLVILHEVSSTGAHASIRRKLADVVTRDGGVLPDYLEGNGA
jgi:hypothetical protein